MDDGIIRRRRRLPHWRLAGATYFITFRLMQGELSMDERLLVLEHIRSGHGRFYDLVAAVVMPDHAHGLITPHDGVTLSRITKGIKGVSAHLLNQRRQSSGAVWQDESYDRIMRDSAELDEKLQYIWENPLRAGLVNDPEEYPAVFIASQD